MFLYVLIVTFASCSAHTISVYGDVYTDTEFFSKTFPWLMDNIGGDITVDYFMLGSGRYSVPQMCALRKLRMNTYLQAQYLKCEADGNPSEYCLCETGIDPKTFKDCVASGGALTKTASTKFTELGVEVTPIVELGPQNIVYGVENAGYLSRICTIFRQNVPRGCVRPSNQIKSYAYKNALAQFDRQCRKEFPIDYDENQTPETTYPAWSAVPSIGQTAWV